MARIKFGTPSFAATRDGRAGAGEAGAAMAILENVQEHLLRVAEIGRDSAGGWTRLAYTESETDALSYAKSVFESESYGLVCKADQFGNLIAQNRASLETDGGSLYIGTHLDTVRQGGNYDGVVGFVVAAEVIQLVQLRGPEIPLAAVVFRAEESTRFRRSCLGSSAMLFGLSDEDLALEAVGLGSGPDRDITLLDAIQSATGRQLMDAGRSIDPKREMLAYLETHIEQATVLWSDQGCPKLDDPAETSPPVVGVVTSIRAAHRCQWMIHSDRECALLLLAGCVLAVESIAQLGHEIGMDVVATIGSINDLSSDVAPEERAVLGADKVNAVPGLLSIRLADAAPLDDTPPEQVEGEPDPSSARKNWQRAVRIAKARNCDIELLRNARGEPARMVCHGETNHSGGTPMGRDYRKDALAATSEIILHLGAKVFAAPSSIEFITDVRSRNIEDRWAVMDAIEREFQLRLSLYRQAEQGADAGPPSLRLEKTKQTEWGEPTRELDDSLRSQLSTAAKQRGVQLRSLPSGAGHDAMIVARAGVPTAMLFVPSYRGLSHNPDEFTRAIDIASAIEVKSEAIISWWASNGHAKA